MILFKFKLKEEKIIYMNFPVFGGKSMKVKKQILIITLFVLLTIFLTSCIKSGISNNETDSTTEPVFSSISIVKMDLSRVMTTTVEGYSVNLSSVTTSEVGNYYIVYVDLTSEDHQIKHELIESTEVSLSLDKGHVYVVGLFKYTEEGIVPVGLVGSEDAGISSLPITSDATDVIDLGTLEATNGILSTTITTEKFAEILGFVDAEAIKQFGGYDITLKNLLNPDINQNGVFDDGEGIWWREETNYDYTIENLEDFDSPKNPENYIVNPPVILIWLNYKNHDLEYGRFSSTPSATLITPSGREILTYNSDGDDNKNDRFYIFDLPTFEENLNGEYTLILHDNTAGEDISLKFNWAFLNPKNQIKGMLFPINKTIAFADGVLKEERIKWYYAKNDGSIEIADDSIVKLLGKDILACFWEDVSDVPKIQVLDMKKNENGTYFLNFEEGKWRQLRTFFFKVMRMMYSDIAGNTINVRGPVEHSDFPYNYEALNNWFEASSASLVGVWYNHGFIRDSANYSVVVFQPDGKLEIFDNWEGILWSKLNPTAVLSYELNGSDLTITDDGGYSETLTIKEAEAEDGRRFIKLERDGEILVYTNFYSYINSFGKIFENNGYEYVKLVNITIDSTENNTLSWSINWDEKNNWGLVGFDFYLGTSEDNLKLVYFQYEDWQSMMEGNFQVNLKSLLNLEPGTYYVKIVANTWKEIKESNVVQIQIN